MHHPSTARQTLAAALLALSLFACGDASDGASAGGEGSGACATCDASTSGGEGTSEADAGEADAPPEQDASADSGRPQDASTDSAEPQDVASDTAAPDTSLAPDAALDTALSDDADASPDAAPDTAEPLPPHLETVNGARLAYLLSWDWEGATPDDDGVMVFETDLGYTVGLEAGYVGSGQLELVPCAGGTWVAPPEPEPWWRPVLDWLGPRKAWADHPVVTDVSRVQADLVESVYDEGSREYGVAEVEGSTYCDLHYLITPMEATSDDGFQMQRWSAYVRGWYIAPGAAERAPFEATINIRGGAIPTLTPSEALPDTWLDASGMPLGARVLLTRFPARSFHGIALDEVADVDLAYEFLLNIGRTSRAEFQLNR